MNSALKTLLLLALTSGALRADDQAFAIHERDANSKTWVKTNEVGEVTSSFVELATGGSKRNPVDGTWSDADASIVIVQGPEGGAVAENGQHRLILSADANSENATVDVEMLDGQRIQLQTIGIALTSLDNSRSIFIGEVKQSIGQQVDANTVIYPDAFAPIKASLRVRNTLDGFESDVILEEKIDPTDWNFVANNCKLEVWTQVLQSPDAHVKVERIPGRRVGDADQDQQIAFNNMAFAKGSAFRLDTLLPGASDQLAKIRVAKELAEFPAENLSFLIEAVPFLEAKPMLDTLPVNEARLKPAKDKFEQAMVKNVTGKRAKPNSMLAEAHPKGPKHRAMASLSKNPLHNKPGFVMDYSILSSSAGFTFKGDTTYYIKGNVNLTGTTTIESGTVLKFTNSVLPSITIGGPVNCTATSYRPAVITAKDDDTVGEIIPGSTGNPMAFSYYALRPLDLTYAAFNSVQHLLVRYSFNGVTWHGGGGEVRHSQFYHCQHAIETSSGGTVFVRNVLIHDCESHFVATGASLAGENVTMDGGLYGFNNLGSSVLTLTNSIIYNVTTPGTFTGVNNFTTFSASPFQSAGAGAHYLATGSSLRDAGTPNISAQLAKELRQMTTEPPVTSDSDFTAPTVLYPLVTRDTDSIDAGYHYDPLDYLWSGRILTSTLVLTNGVAVGWNSAVGLTLGSGAAFYSEGKPDCLNRLVRWTGVQELGAPVTSGTTTRLLDIISTASIPSVWMRFTDVPFLADIQTKRYLINSASGYTLTSMAFVDSSFRGAVFNLTPSKSIATAFNIALTNNFCDRVYFSVTRNLAGDTTPVNVWMHQNLFHGGTLFLNNYGATGAWGVCNNLFENNALSAAYNSIVHGTNAYFNTAVLPGTTSGNKTVTAVDYVSGPLGNFYYPASGAGLFTLVNQGNRTANTWGLYHYTTQTSQAKETTSTVDIGFHYVATDAAGIPIDTDLDGAADYLEDKNGNGSTDAGETGFTIADSDGDGIPDGWEYIYGLNPLVNDAYADKDGDGVCNKFEYLLGSDPSDSSNNGRASINADHTLAIRADGKVFAWGNNTYGQLGNNSTTPSTEPVLLPTPLNIVQVFAGKCHSLALTASGQLFGWGIGTCGALGTSTNVVISQPTLITTNLISQISGGDSCTIWVEKSGVIKRLGNTF